MRISRRNALSAMAMGTLGMAHSLPLWGEGSNVPSKFRYCLNTSTISGQNSGLLKYIEIASQAGYDTLKMLNGSLIDIFHMNDYPENKPREQQDDADRVYPGDGAAPMSQILTALNNMGERSKSCGRARTG